MLKADWPIRSFIKIIEIVGHFFDQSGKLVGFAQRQKRDNPEQPIFWPGDVELVLFPTSHGLNTSAELMSKLALGQINRATNELNLAAG